VQTLQRRALPEADLVIVDEAHRIFTLYARWMLDPAWARVPFIGLSATPWTRGLGRYFDDLLIPTTLQELIDSGHLSPFRVFAPSHPDLTGVRTVAGDFHEGDLSAAMSKGALVADVVETWKQRGENRSTFCFAVDRLHAKALQERFLAAGVAAEYMDAYTALPDREVIRKKFHDGTCRVVCNVGVLTVGVDWDVRALILARPTKSEMLFVQIVGRALRRAEGKESAILLDHSDNHLRLGFVTDIHHDKLNDGRERVSAKREGPPLPKECPQCTFLRPPRVGTCPSCGFKATPTSKIACEDGELAELTRKVNDGATKQRWYSMLLFHARRRGFKEGWAANQYRQRFGVWPLGLSDYPVEPDGEVMGYIQHAMIRYAKGRASHEQRTS
jgi:superfamily II DNA or RNA helicase